MSTGPSPLKRFAVPVIAIIFLAVTLYIQRTNPILRYLFHMRFSLGIGLLLIALPVLGLKLMPGMLKALFYLRSTGQMALTVFLAFMNALMVVVTSRTIALYANKRFPELDPLADDIYPTWWFLGLVIAIPMIWGVCKTSKLMSIGQKAQGVLIGTIGAALIIFFSFWVLGVSFKKPPPGYVKEVSPITRIMTAPVTFINKHTQFKNAGEPTRGILFDGYIRDREGSPRSGYLYGGHAFALTLILFLVVIYLVGYKIFEPSPTKKINPPTIYYVLLMMLFSGFLLSGISYFLDLYSVPVAFTLLVAIIIAYRFWNIDHYYRVFTSSDNSEDQTRGPVVRENLIESLENRFKNYQDDDNRTLVVVSSAGGGIQASGWTTQVLGGLQKELGESFTQAVGIVSSVSGGSVGTMHYLDHFDIKKGAVNPDSLEAGSDRPLIKVADDSVAESLYATGWGLAYPDYLKVIGLPFLAGKEIDRGWAIEQAWKGNLNYPKANFTKWRELVLKGMLPLPVFNSTIVETGQRFMLSPLPFCWEGARDRTKIDFHLRYPGKDVEAVTAARLSATFPYVTPVCRTNLPDDVPFAGRHIADGGYFDNFGVFTTLEWLKEIIFANGENPLKIKNLLMLELNGFPQSPPDNGANPENGFKASLLGPLLAILNVRTSTQVARNRAEVDSFINRYGNKINVKQVEVRYPKVEVEPPLSWKLTRNQKESIRDSWHELLEEQGGALDQIRDFWSNR